MKLCIVVGARPNFIKAAPLITEIKRNQERNKDITFFLIHTGQHYDENMSEVFFKEMGIPQPDFHLHIGSGHHGKQTGEMIGKIEELLISEQPDMLISIGDTNSTLAGALAAAKLHIPIAHIEAGLRSHNKQIPEEVNRVLTDHIAALNFVPTKLAKENLLNEGLKKNSICLYGDIMYDATLQFNKVAAKTSKVLKTNGLKKKQYILATVHRAENTAGIQKTQKILDGFVEVAKQIKVVLPMHPRTRNLLSTHNLLDHYAQHIAIINPLGYLDMLVLEKNARLIVTDSGGVQKEAFFQQTPCVTLFQNSPWQELIDMGWNTVVPPKSAAFIAKNVIQALDSKPGKKGKPYGRGNSAALMLEAITGYLEKNKKETEHAE